MLMAKPKKFVYAVSCVDLSNGDDIQEMVDVAIETNYETVQKHCRGLLDWAEKQGYARRQSDGLTLKHDWAVRYFRSTFRGRKCYYVRRSAIEYIWCEER